MIKMTSRLLILCLAVSSYQISAKEGMWLPMLIEKLNIEEMQSMGFKLEASDIYDINKACLKDAVMLFGRGCTAELISDKGLILTNHHCGFSQIQKHSTLENDYLTNGFWANNRQEELSNPGLSVTILRFMEDVTTQVTFGVDATMTELERKGIIAANIDSIQKQHQENEFVKAAISPFYFGNQYILFVSDIYKDVRLVGAPPSAIGKFGGDTDNWMWPRHGGDFSVFRIYANKNNEPSEYSDDNVPFKPNYVLPISLRGVEEGDFTMVFGFPGTTQQYATSHLIKSMRDNSYPKLIKIRDTKLNVIDAAMDKDAETRIKYAGKAASISNSWKRWIGELKGFERFDVIRKKELQEATISKWIEEKNKTEYNGIYDKFEAMYAEYEALNLASSITSELLFRNGIEVFSLAEKTLRFDLKTKDGKEKYRSEANNMFKDYDLKTDKELAEQLLPLYLEFMPKKFQSDVLISELTLNKSDQLKQIEKLYKKSFFTDKNRLYKMLDQSDKRMTRRITKSSAFKISSDLSAIYYKRIRPQLNHIKTQIDSLNRTYIQLLTEFDSSITAYPDANLTLRLGYGQVASYDPRDAVSYKFATTLDGIMEKDNPNVYDYRVPERLKELYKDKDFGDYRNKDGALPVCFIATNHTTGGNSGSPVLNANGELIGLNFDRAWEGVMSDFYYNPEICRNISVDIRYVLFIIDKFAGASYLLDEMQLIK